MVQQVDYNGTTHEFPDEATPAMISQALGLSGQQESAAPRRQNLMDTARQMMSRQQENSAAFRNALMNPAQTEKDFRGGIVKGIANLPVDISNLAIGGGNLVRKLMGNEPIPYMPRFDFKFAPDTPASNAGGVLSGLLAGAPAAESLLPSIGSAIESGASTAGKVAAETGAAAGKAAGYLNPLKLTKSGIAKSVLDAEKAMKDKYSGPNGLYTQHFADARSRGLGDVNVDPSMVDLGAISKNTPHKYYEATETFLKEPTIENAQKAVSDLGFMERTLTNRYVSKGLTDPESQALDAAIKAKQHIQRQMFTDPSGKFHPDLYNDHKAIQQGYANEVIPYTKNVALQNFKNRKLTLDQLIPRLSKGEFGAKRAEFHPAIGIRKLALPLVKYGGVAEGVHLLDQLMNRR